MNQPSGKPGRYRVVYSERVRSELKELLRHLVARGFGQLALNTLRELDFRLQVYPQFGEPLRDLKTEGEKLWIGTVPPWVVQYIVDEKERLVFVVLPLKTLLDSGSP